MALHRSEQKYELVTGKLENESTVRPPKKNDGRRKLEL